jgi:hypothetical protein
MVLGGTSGAAPAWAAFTALYNQNAAGSKLPQLGFANPTLYSLGSNPQLAPPFHDITTGNNLNYSATAGWDYPTGWGTTQLSRLIADLIQQTAPAWARSATAAAAGGTPAAPPHRWFGAPSVVRPSTPTLPLAAAPPTPTLPRQGGGKLDGWAARFMPDVMARLTGWLSSP